MDLGTHALFSLAVNAPHHTKVLVSVGGEQLTQGLLCDGSVREYRQICFREECKGCHWRNQELSSVQTLVKRSDTKDRVQ